MSPDAARNDGGSSEYEAAVREYHASRARYIRTVTSDTERILREAVAKRRDPLMREITDLSALARVRFETRKATLQAYAAKAPGRVTAAGLQPPSAAEWLISGIDKLYKAALKANEEFVECNDIIKKRKEKLEEIDREVRTLIEKNGRELIAQLETAAGLERAFKRDPLLSRAHARMIAAQARRTPPPDGAPPAADAGVPAS
jgi:hypothetical protein